MSKKRVRTEMTPSQSTLGVLSFEAANHPVVKYVTVNKNDTVSTYAHSDPKGKDVKDYMFNLHDLTNIMCPKWSLTIKSYGFNWAGGHKYDDQYGGVKTAYSTAATGTATDGIRFAVDDVQTVPGGWCDTVAWEGGSQGWFESVFLPATFRNTNNTDLEQTHMKIQASMEGIIEAAYNVSSAARLNEPNLTHAPYNTNAARKQDFAIHYNGGSQTHYFHNPSQSRCSYELYELTPRDIIPNYMYELNLTNTRIVSIGVHEYATADYVNRTFPTTLGLSAATRGGTYNTSLDGGQNANGQIICSKNDLGFKLAPWQDSVHQTFRVSKGLKGTIEPGGKLVYTMKTGGFKMLNSTYRRIIKGRSSDNDPTNDEQFNNAACNHLIPKFSKILVVRFWSDISTKTMALDKVLTVENPHSFETVTNGPGRLAHYMVEKHTARAVPVTQAVAKVYKDYMKLDYNNTAADFAAWTGINDETDNLVPLR